MNRVILFCRLLTAAFFAMVISINVIHALSNETQYINSACGTDGNGTTSLCANGATGPMNNFATWETQNRNLVTEDKNLTAVFAGDFSTCGTVTGWTTDATRRILIQGMRCTGTIYGASFILDQDYVDLLDVTGYKAANGNQGRVFWFYATWIHGTIDRWTIYHTGTGTTDGGASAFVIDPVNDAVRTVRNGVCHHAFNSCLEMGTNGGSVHTVDNNTFADSGDEGFGSTINSTGSTTTVIMRNNLSTGNNVKVNGSTDYNLASGWGTFTHSGNISSDTSSPDAAGDSKVISYTNAAAGDYTLQAGETDAIGQGTDITGTFTTERAGGTRTAPVDVGAYKYTAAGGGAPKFSIEALQLSPLTGVH